LNFTVTYNHNIFIFLDVLSFLTGYLFKFVLCSLFPLSFNTFYSPGLGKLTVIIHVMMKSKEIENIKQT